MTSPQQQVWQVKFLIIGGVKIYDFLFITSNETNFLWFPSILHNYGIKMTQSTSTNDRVIKKNSPYSFVSIWQLIHSVHYSWIPWNLSFRYTFIHEKKQQPTFTVLQWCTAWIPWNLSFRYIHCTGQFTPKMKQTRNYVCFHLWCELTLVLWCYRIVWSLFFHEWKCNGMTSFMEFRLSNFSRYRYQYRAF